MADDEFEMYFARAKIEENWTNQGLPQRRCSLPALASTDIMQSRYRCGSSVKKSRKKSVPYGPHEYSHTFPSPILEVTSPNLEVPQEADTRASVDTSQELGEAKRSMEPMLFVYPSLNIPEEVAEGEEEEETEEEENIGSGGETADLCVIRNFKSSPKGIVNRGDSIKKTRRASIATCRTDTQPIRRQGVTYPPELSSLDLCSTFIREHALLTALPSQAHLDSEPQIDVSKKVVIIGEKGVGKTSLMRQLMTSNYMGPLDSPQEMVSSWVNLAVTLDGEETSIELHKFSSKQIGSLPQPISAYLVVFAVDSKSSYEGAKVLLDHYRSTDPHVALILVANKTDLARRRLVSAQDAKSTCRRVHAKYSEVSVSLNHNVDNLLVGTIRQISFNPVRQVATEVRTNPAKEHKLACLPLPKGLTKRLSLKSNVQDCENLSVL